MMVTIEGNLVVEGGHILGRLEPLDIPGVLGRRCSRCGALVPVPNWGYHSVACHEVGWGRYKNPIANFVAPATKRRSPTIDFAKELGPLLAKR